METKDLMIGDWVVFHDSGYASDGTVWKKDRVCQIDSIDTCVRVKWYDEDGCEEEWPNVSVMHLSPIPLTPEILERMGFTAQSNIGYIIDDYDGEQIIYDRWNHNLRIIINYKVCLDIETFDDIAVHELQHALRLCGIEKEIIL